MTPSGHRLDARALVWVTEAFAALVAFLFATTQASASAYEYLYAESNAGSSAGGHFALRLDDWVYDFQNAELGTLRLRRTDYDTFRYLYTVRENRTLHTARIEVPQQTREAIFDRFNLRYLSQNKQFSNLDSLRADRELIRGLIARDGRAKHASGERRIHQVGPGVRIHGAGFFYDEHGRDVGGESEALRELRDQLLLDLGPNALTDRIGRLEVAASSLSPSAEANPMARVAPDARLKSVYRFSDRYRDLAAKIVALRVLRWATPIQPDARRILPGSEYELGAEEIRQIRAYAARLKARLAKLATSRRPDWGYPMLLGMARLQTLRESLARGRWVVLDSVPADAGVLSANAVRRGDPFVVELRDRARRAFREARSHFANAPHPDEPALAWLEESANRYAEFQRGFARDDAIPIYEGGRLPDRMATVQELPVPAVDLRTLRRAAEVSERQVDEYVAALRRVYGYRLVSNNCVTEIFAMIASAPDPAFAGDGLREGGDARGLLSFIPVVAYREVLDAHVDAEASEIPSYRRVRLEAMYEVENDLLVHLRESNTLTSAIYRRNDVEPFFLFFTEGAAPIRPILGVFNLVAGIGEAALGLLRAPWDRGAVFRSGLAGAAYSLPELLFVNLRRGRLEYAPGDSPRTQRRPAQIRTALSKSS